MTDTFQLFDLVARRAAETPDALFGQDETGRQMTWGEAHRQALRVAAALVEQGISSTSVVAWQLPNRLEAAVLVFALNRLGCLQVPLLPILGDRELSFALRQTRADLIITAGVWNGKDFEARARAMSDAMTAEGQPLRQLTLERELPQGDTAVLAGTIPAEPPSVRWCFYTSGSTGDPKGVLHTDASVHASAIGLADRWRLCADDRGVYNFPFTHIGAFGWLYAQVLHGFPMLFLEAFSPEQSIPLMRDFGVTVAGAGPPFFVAYLNAQLAHGTHESILPSVRAFGGGGSPKPQSLHGELKAAFGIGVLSTYGMTESPMTVMTSPDDPDEVLATTEGHPVLGAEVRVVGPDGNALSTGQEGEVQVRADQLFVGYVDSALDEPAFTADRWYRTGDLGRLDADGNLAITGRLKDVIIRNMENVSAQEIEELLIARPDVAEVAVIGVPDDRTGERVCAVVVLAEGAEPFDLDALYAWCVDQGLMKQKVPEQLEFVDRLPRHPMGKVVKTELRKAFAA